MRVAAVSDACADQDDTGFCLVCGATVDGIEPDATNYRCPHCTAEHVFGAEEILLQIAF